MFTSVLNIELLCEVIYGSLVRLISWTSLQMPQSDQNILR